ncbi:MAG: hypothetical protein K8H89_09610 [Flavobacteriales bacterium]|jgi:class 3 adenylate cyclase|nr:hypothetical protein [Flavobacteriales bacterium]
MNKVFRYMLAPLLVVSGIPCSGQAMNADSLWRVWDDTTRTVGDRCTALGELFLIDTSLTAVEAVSRIMPVRSTDTLSRAYVMQSGFARYTEGSDHGDHGRYAEAFAVLRQAAEGFHRINERRYESHTYRLIGKLFVRLGQFNAAANYQIKTLKGYETLGDTANIFQALWDIAYSYSQMGERLLSQQVYRQCLELDAGRDADWEFDILQRLAYYADTEPSALSAETCLERARALVASGKVSHGQGKLDGWEANNLLDAGQCDSALVRLERQLLRFRNAPSPNRPWISYTLSQLAKAHLCAHRYKKALLYAKEGLAVTLEGRSIKESMDNLEPLALAYEGLGDERNALLTWKQYYALVDSTRSNSSAANLSGALLAADFAKQQFADSLTTAQERELERRTADADIQRERTRRNIFLFSGLGLLIFGVIIFRQRGRIQKALHQSDELLLNILPEQVAEELKTKGEADAKQIDQVTVLFTDFKGFTAMSEKLTAKELVADIHECFSAFDHIMEKHNIEKIKTIGDSYMAAGGLPTPNNTHAVDVVKAALEIRDFIAEGKAGKMAAGQPYFEIRIGVHTGPVVAGIVGVKKFQYDIWGDTVNTASRMESSGEVGQVNISEATYALVKDLPGFIFTSRGRIQAKGKGEMEMYFVSRGA